MSEKMYPIPFRSLMNWVVTEYAGCGDVFGVHKQYHATGKSLPIFGERIETPFGPAAGPNSQLAQNIFGAYVAGARFFEVKTVQKMDGADLAACVPRPCILANDEGYNQECATELTVPQAMDEYIKAWCALKVLSKVYGFGDPDGFVFNMSVGYDLEGIKGDKVNTYIEGMKDANKTAIFGECKAVLKELFPEEWLVEKARDIARETGGSGTLTEDVTQGATDADVIYTDIWVSMGEPDSVWSERIRLLTPYQVTEKVMALPAPGAIFMHCLPSFHDTRTTIGADIAKKFGITEMEVTDQVVESKQSVVFDEAENRMHTIKAVIYATLH